MSRYILDTSGYSRFKHGDGEIVAIIDAAEWIGVPSIVLGELWTGFMLGRRAKENERELREFLENPAVEELVVDASVARVYAEIMTSLRESGTPLPVNDIWIAACAASAGASVLTYHAHFRQIRRIGSIVLA